MIKIIFISLLMFEINAREFCEINNFFNNPDIKVSCKEEIFYLAIRSLILIIVNLNMNLMKNLKLVLLKNITMKL